MVSIHELLEKIKPYYAFILCAVIVSIFAGFWRLSAVEEKHTPVRISSPQNKDEISQTASAISGVEQSESSPSGEVIGSKTGKKYYFPWCGTIKRVKPENQVVFASIDLARVAGYVPGGNCKGLK